MTTSLIHKYSTSRLSARTAQTAQRLRMVKGTIVPAADPPEEQITLTTARVCSERSFGCRRSTANTHRLPLVLTTTSSVETSDKQIPIKQLTIMRAKKTDDPGCRGSSVRKTHFLQTGYEPLIQKVILCQQFELESDLINAIQFSQTLLHPRFICNLS